MQVSRDNSLPLSANFWKLTLLILLSVLCFGNSALCRDLRHFEQALFRPDKLISNNPHVEGAVHNVGKIGLAVTNYGSIGTGFIGFFPDPISGLPAPSCQYPYPSSLDYLFAGAFWIGAVVGSDTLVSVGADGWDYLREMWPDSSSGLTNSPIGGFERHSISDAGDEKAVSEQDLICIYTDTLTVPAYVENDPYDSRHHKPLNIEVTQRSYAWSYDYAEDFVIFDMSIKNIGQSALTETYFGIYVDGDVGTTDNGDRFIDDICGFKRTVASPQGCGFIDTVNIAWIVDNDGKDKSTDMCPYTQGGSPTSVTGVRILRTSSDSLKMAFNWWMSNGNAALDFGPRRAGTTEDPFRDFGGFLGTPEGDKNKYYVMRHEECDYDQLFTAVNQTAEGWLPPPTNAADIAEGFDTRYLLSFGPFEIMPGQTIPFAFAYVAGENFHTDCEAFQNLFDAAAPEAYYSQLDFSDLALNALWAEWIYDTPGVDTDHDGYRGKYRICGNDTIFYQGDGVPDLFAKPPTDVPDQPGSLEIPSGFSLYQNYPNPFNTTTEIAFEIPSRADVTLTILNILSQEVREIEIGEKPAGRHTIIWDGTDDSQKSVSSGVYFYKIKAGMFASSKKMILLK